MANNTLVMVIACRLFGAQAIATCSAGWKESDPREMNDNTEIFSKMLSFYS